MTTLFTLVYGFIISSFFGTSLQAAQATAHKVADHTYKITLTIPIKKGHYLNADSIHCSINNPHATITRTWQPETESVHYFDEAFKESQKAFNQPVIGTLEITYSGDTHQHSTALYCSYYTTEQNAFVSDMILLDDLIKKNNPEQTTTIAQNNIYNLAIKEDNSSCTPSQCTTKNSWSEKIATHITTTQSLWLQIFLVFLLGILMSLTPCIYPMIPITIGILQAQGSKTSFLRNFLLALSYTCGIAITFAFLGLLAAFSGKLFGTLLANPIVISIMCAVLVYLGLSMLGLYEMYVPRFLQPSTTTKSSGSFTSAFLLGAISGTVASPCLSPGLILLLSIVTSLGSMVLGFVLLFAFGVGTATPLLLIGSFSGAMNILPRAGMWMVEVKRFFGLILIGMCFYFLQNIMPLSIVFYLMAFTSCALGILYLSLIKKYDTITIRIIKNIIGTTLIASSVLFLAKGYQTTFLKKNINTTWETCYFKSIEKAHKEQKLLFIDIGAPCCSICHAIDKKLLQDTTVLKTLTSSYVTLKIDGSDENPSSCMVNKTYQIQGFPTILAVDPATQKIIKKWGAELYKYTIEEFIAELNAIATRK